MASTTSKTAVRQAAAALNSPVRLLRTRPCLSAVGEHSGAAESCPAQSCRAALLVGEAVGLLVGRCVVGPGDVGTPVGRLVGEAVGLLVQV